MSRRPFRTFIATLVASAVVALMSACNGGGGSKSTTGGGTTEPPGTTVSLATLTPEQWAALEARVTVTQVAMGAAPVVTFRLTDAAGNGLVGLAAFTATSGGVTTYPNLSMAMAKLVPENNVTRAPSKWVSYIVTSTSGAPARPTADNSGTLVDNGDGTYQYTFARDITQAQSILDAATYTGNNLRADLGDVTYVPTLTHRLAIQFYGNARGTGNNTSDGVTVTTGVPLKAPINTLYDFVPSRGEPVTASDTQRNVASTRKCQECHGTAFATTPHTGRVELGYCALCHTDQRKYGRAVASAGTTTTYTGRTDKFQLDATTTTAAGELTAMVHRTHMGNLLTKTGYNYADEVKFETLGYSILDGGQKHCTKCHSGSVGAGTTAQGENWNLRPTRETCGTCHDGVDFNTGTGHGDDETAQSSDVACFTCHTSDKIKAYHQSVNLTANNPTVAEGLVNFRYEISEVTQPTSGGPVTIKFRFLSDNATNGATYDAVTTLNTTAVSGGVSNPLEGFTGAPSFVLAWSLTQEGLTSPIDFNNLAAANGNPDASNYQPRTVSLKDLLDTTKTTSVGTLSGPDGSGYYTANVVGATKIFPAGAKMRTAVLQGYFTQVSPAAARHAISVTRVATGDTARRVVVDSAKCASCHEWFEGHGGNRVYDIQSCTVCHVPGLATSGRGMSDSALSAYWANFTTAIRLTLTAWTGIDFTTNPVVAGNTQVALSFPQTTNNLKDMIHGIHAGHDRTTPIAIVRDRTPSAVNVIDGAVIGFPGVLSDCATCHRTGTFSGVPDATLASREEAINPAGNTTTALAKSALGTTNATDLMTTPFAAACVSCHDSTPAKAHIALNGGQIRVARSSLNTAGEACAVCHGSGAAYDAASVHE